MRDISLSSLDQTNNKLPAYTFCLYGNSRSGKTHFAATMPRPFIIADVAESGYKTILSMDRDLWFEPNVEPIIVGVDQMSDVAQMASTGGRLDQLIKNGRVMSVVFDAFSFYADYFLGQLFKLQSADKQDNRKAYGDLGKHLTEIRNILGQKGASVAYLCLAKHPDDEDPKGKPLIPGKSADKYCAGVDFVWHTELRQVVEGGKIVREIREIHTRQKGSYIAGNRLGVQADQLPNPLVGTYADFLASLGYDVDEIRRGLPKPQAATPQPVARTIAQPARSTVVARPVPSNNSARPVGSPTGANPAHRGAKP